ncbi:uncharacterized protein LOC111042872 [Myzus persicae]|uniref:uncharacterized protein LOC111042872 n=1 Tax=Myzus persicae TaxID=13164 RepID=UPI000B93913C|nr:uncharacterized protein LOC111042872 [Myzus persicae]
MISSNTLAMFRAMSALALLLLLIVGGLPIPINSEENEDTKKNNVNEFRSAPPTGDGNFRDPLEILGVKFPESKIIHLCKANVYMYADFVSDVTFPTDASKLCGSVCKSYRESMYTEQGVTVSLINSNCDYTGDTIIVEHNANETHPATCPDLSTACVCAYNVRCNRKTKLMKYTLTPNEKGYLRVLAADCGSSGYVT